MSLLMNDDLVNIKSAQASLYTQRPVYSPAGRKKSIAEHWIRRPHFLKKDIFGFDYLM